MIKFGVAMYASIIYFECPKETLVKQVLDTIKIFDIRYTHDLIYENNVLIPKSTLYEMCIKENGIINVIRVNQGSFDFFAKSIYKDIPKVIRAVNHTVQPLAISSISNIDGLARSAILATQEAIHDDECLRIAIREAFAADKSKVAFGLLEKHNFTKLSQDEMNYITNTVERFFTEARYRIDATIAEIKSRGQPSFKQLIPIPKEIRINPIIEKNPQIQSKGPIIALPHLELSEHFPFEVPTKSKNNK